MTLTLILQVISLVCFFIGWMSWTIPGPPHRAWNWTTGGFFWLLLSFMLVGAQLWAQLRPVH